MGLCAFCQIVTNDNLAQVVYEDDKHLAFLDKYPQTRGHIQLIPKKHVRWIYEIEEIGKFFVTAKKLIHVIIPVLEADHVTLAAYGREIKHAHLWIVPQYVKEVTVKEGQGNEHLYDDQEKLARLLRQKLMTQ